ncbi:MAG: hypothetical protein ICV75_02360 [Nitrospiraceae bacterium]|jgi:hypothetical protein|nr:hypothetical protein [Nitrospiraceae bacterium]
MMDETVARRKSEPAPGPDGPLAGKHKPGIELLIGSNRFRNTNGVVKIHGKEQLVLEAKDGVLYATIDLYNEAGAHVAHIRRNVMVLNQTGQFAIDLQGIGIDAPDQAPAVRIHDQRTDTVVFEATVTAENRIAITAGRFCSHKGTAVEITPHYCRIGCGTTRFGDIVENRGGTVVLG